MILKTLKSLFSESSSRTSKSSAIDHSLDYLDSEDLSEQTWTWLPSEIIGHILEYLPPFFNIQVCSLICKQFRRSLKDIDLYGVDFSLFWSGDANRTFNNKRCLENRYADRFVDIQLPFWIIGKDEDVKCIVHCPNMKRLRRLVMNGGRSGFFRTDSLALSIIGKSSVLTELQELEFKFHSYGITSNETTNMEDLITSASMKNITSLNFEQTFIMDTGVRILFSDKSCLDQLKRLVLDASGVGNEGIKAMCASEKCKNLTHLSLRRIDLGPHAIVLSYLASSPYLTQLTHLDMSSCFSQTPSYESKEYEKMFSSSQNLIHLKTLILSMNRFTQNIFQAIPKWDYLERLDISSTEIGDAGIQLMTKSPSLHSLKHLDISNCRIGVVGASAISKFNMPYLKSLKMNSNKISNKGMEHFCNSRLLCSGLEVLQLNANYIGIEGAIMLSRVEKITLFELSLLDNNFGKQGFEAIMSNDKLLKIVKLDEIKEPLSKIAPLSLYDIE
ncbi:hypothetical protein C9374_001582 [Naegleria lovaniensis]|uniref:F-box domain-containing protein n=1 Tax=Naegleria lovaniensis TaxID=51637 RepID=A0AA88KKX4_NAELO|nr:uncharacterized protein C9374_001582 [Naegleria lovaniensis]KAG2387250.1 hypothetical protein C9374_001582 [Naegleria lovaniensis]